MHSVNKVLGIFSTFAACKMNVMLLNAFCLLVATFSLMIPAFINGYPIVYSDTSTYIASGFDLNPPFDRPITYGLFIRVCSLNGISLWFVIGIQSLLLALMILRLVRDKLVDYKYPQVIGLLIISFLSLFTGVSWTSSQLMPDIFTAILVLSTTILLTSSTTKKERVFLYFIFFLSSAMHMSHITFCIVYFIGILIFRELNLWHLKQTIKVKLIVFMISLTLASITIMGSALSKSKHVFLMGALVEHGIAKKYLDEHCERNQYKLCVYKDVLPEKAWQFIWEESSPFYKIGGWKDTKQEFNEIILNTLTSPRFLALHVKESIKATFDQLIKFKIGDGNGVFLKGTLLYERVGKYFTHELSRYEGSRQNQGRLSYINWFNTLQIIRL